MNIEQLRAHSGMVACASLMLRRGYDKILKDEESPDNINACIAIAFDGDIQQFEQWAASYLAEGCGVDG